MSTPTERLQLVHGTFSTSAAFRGLLPAVVEELSRRYGGRVFAFNHPTLTADPHGERAS